MAKNESKNQHYVPLAYLRHFANSKEMIWAFDKSTGREFQPNIANIAAERRFYDNDEIGSITGDKQFIENKLSNDLEGHYATISSALIKDLSSGKFRSLSNKHRHFLATFMVVQMLRTKESLIKLEQLTNSVLDIYKKTFCKKEFEPPLDEELLGGMTREETARDVQHRSLLNGATIQDMSLILYRHIWFIQEAFEEDEFITSDHPFVKRGHITSTGRSRSGIDSTGVEILFPLSPRYLLTLVDREHFATMAKLDGVKLRLVSHDNMIYNNDFQIRQSSRFVFSRKNNFDFVRAMIAESPIYGDLNRKRIKINNDM
jgi:Protein of unknown function (DUF4238)